jgi:hypothetical protein
MHIRSCVFGLLIWQIVQRRMASLIYEVCVFQPLMSTKSGSS